MGAANAELYYFPKVNIGGGRTFLAEESSSRSMLQDEDSRSSFFGGVDSFLSGTQGIDKMLEQFDGGGLNLAQAASSSSGDPSPGDGSFSGLIMMSPVLQKLKFVEDLNKSLVQLGKANKIAENVWKVLLAPPHAHLAFKMASRS